MPGAEPGEQGRQFFRAHVDVLDDPAPEHGGRHIPTAALLLCFVQDPQHDALRAGEAVANVGQEVPLGFQGLNSVFSFFFTATPLMVT
jgi:hypothetical protein